MFYCYILYSQSLDRYYVGSCGEDLEGRLRRHLTEHNGFTAKAKDWQVVHRETFDTQSAAYARERKIKSLKSRRYIEGLLGN